MTDLIIVKSMSKLILLSVIPGMLNPECAPYLLCAQQKYFLLFQNLLNNSN